MTLDQQFLPELASLAPAQQKLLDWFSAHARDLPWRRTRDPYRILVSEIMLQQTQVDRVLPKYLAFLEAFPTPESLAAAPTADVIRLWAGLGYNRRAVNLQRAVRAVLDEHGGVFPRAVAALQALPGIGPYTAGAVACFAFEQDVAFMDTNIRRVLRRWLIGPEDAAPVTNDRVLTTAGQALLPPGQGWSWNQAVMELGALICTASAPACWRCPLRQSCRANAAWRSADEGIFDALPTAPAAPIVTGNFAAAQGRRRVAERREEAYAGSRRYYRGRIVAALRELPHGTSLTLDQLGPQVKADYSPDDHPWLHELVAALARDGLLALDGEAVALP